MVQKLIKRILQPKHFWRSVEFDELSELYTSMLLRSMALSLVGIFVPVYLYGIGYSVASIALFYVYFFLGRVVFDFIAAYLVAKNGPKHTIMLSYFTQIISLVMLLSLPSRHWPLAITSIVFGGSSSLFFIAYHVDFSKIKHALNSGKELGYMYTMEKIGAVTGPIIGGLIAAIFGPKYMILAATFAFILAVIPLLKSREPVKLNQKLVFSTLPVKIFKRDIVPYVSMVVENNFSVIVWPLYIVAVVAPKNPYIKIGILTSLGVLASIFMARVYGLIIDNKNGRKLLRISVVLNSLIHMVRVFATQFIAILGINVANEIVTAGYRMPYYKGFYDAADDLPGHRIVYITTMEVLGDIAKSSFWVAIFLILQVVSVRSTIQIIFAVAAVASLLISKEKFKALGSK